MPKKSNLRNEGTALAHSLRYHHGGEGMLTGAGDGWSHRIQARKQREEVELVLARLAFFFPVYSVRDLGLGMGHLHPGWVSPPQFNLS